MTFLGLGEGGVSDGFDAPDCEFETTAIEATAQSERPKRLEEVANARSEWDEFRTRSEASKLVLSSLVDVGPRVKSCGWVPWNIGRVGIWV